MSAPLIDQLACLEALRGNDLDIEWRRTLRTAPPDISAELFDAVQAQLEANNADKASGKNWKAPSLLLRLLFDTHGRKMTAGHATKRKRRYRYYLTHRIGVVPNGPPVERIPAHDIEGIVRDRLVAFLQNRSALLDAYGAENIETVTTLAQKAHEKLIGTSTNTKAAFVDLIQRIDVRSDAVAITLNERSSLGEALSPQTLITPAIKIRAGKQTKMVVQAAGASFTKIDRKLVTLLGEAIAVREMLADGMSLNDAASAIGSGPAYTARKARIGWLAPDIVMAIIEGGQPASLTRRVLSQANNLPLDWNKQRQVLGFDTVNAD